MCFNILTLFSTHKLKLDENAHRDFVFRRKKENGSLCYWFDRWWFMTGNTLKSSLKQTMKHFTSVVEIVIILVVARVCVCVCVHICHHKVNFKMLIWYAARTLFPLTSSHHKNHWNVKIAFNPIVLCLTEFYGTQLLLFFCAAAMINFFSTVT